MSHALFCACRLFVCLFFLTCAHIHRVLILFLFGFSSSVLSKVLLHVLPSLLFMKCKLGEGVEFNEKKKGLLNRSDKIHLYLAALTCDGTKVISRGRSPTHLTWDVGDLG